MTASRCGQPRHLRNSDRNQVYRRALAASDEQRNDLLFRVIGAFDRLGAGAALIAASPPPVESGRLLRKREPSVIRALSVVEVASLAAGGRRGTTMGRWMRRTTALGSAMLLVSAMVLVGAPSALAAGTYHVSAVSGADTNGGRSSSDALASIQEAVDRAGPGDVILVASGVYEGSIDVETSGLPDAWLTIRSSTPHGALVVIPSGFEYEYGFRVAADYVEIDGFRITHEAVGPDHWGAGITVTESHHTRIMRNHVHGVGGSGIEFMRSDHSTVEGNVVHDTSRYAPNQTSGINLYQARAFDSASGFHNIVRGNVSYHNVNTVLRNGETTDGNGIIIDDFRNDHDDDFSIAYPHRTLVENNLVFGNGGKGIHVYLSDHVVLRNNTAYGNNRDALNPAQWRGEFNTSTSGDVTWVNNIAMALPGSGPLEHNTAFLVGRSIDVTIDNNLAFGPAGGDRIVIDGSGQMASMAANMVGVDPRFVAAQLDPSRADFTLKSSSPAVDVGVDAYGLSALDITLQPRVVGTAVDLGAYEHGNAVQAGDGGIPPGGLGSTGSVFIDVAASPFASDIAWLAETGITRGCNPPVNDRFCPDQSVTRGEMAAFLVRALDLPASDAAFVDDDGSVFEADIARLAGAGITRGCDPPVNDRFCPGDPVTRGQMAAFLRRALSD
jgi:parallel beta-helix repeat protein